MQTTLNSQPTKLVTVRISIKEYCSVEAAYAAHRVRIASVLAREAAPRWVRQPAPPSSADSELHQIERCSRVAAEEMGRPQSPVQFQKAKLIGKVIAQ
jgi:hypothetical protein